MKVKMTPEQIEASKKRSMEKFQARKKAQEEISIKLKELRKFCHEHVSFMVDASSGLGYVIGVVQQLTDTGNNLCTFSYSICSSEDEFNFKTAKNIIGERLMDNNSKFSFSIEIPNDVPVKNILAVGSLWVNTMALTNSPVLSQDFKRRTVNNETSSCNRTFFVKK